MKFMTISSAGEVQPVSSNSLTAEQLRQASVIADYIGRMIPHCGADFEIKESDNGIIIEPISLKGRLWRDYVQELQIAPVHTTSEFLSLLPEIIPEEGRDYEVAIVYKGGSKVSVRVMALNRKGELWRSAVLKLLSERPPEIMHGSGALPDNPTQKEEA